MPSSLISSRFHQYLAIALFFLPICIGGRSAYAVNCKITAYAPTEADQAFLHGDYDHAATLYQAQLLQKPDDQALTASLTQVFLKQQKVKQAEDAVQKALAKEPKSAILLTALGEVQYREGTPWLAATSVDNAITSDICYPAAHLLKARILRLNSYYASAAKEITSAHSLDPHDPRIHLQWSTPYP